ncbi:hypothetical protein FRC01_010465 [Tulasnella sp. 417]|nr:hypothetical protein FRC01_010465 [Tulasnella sp. 417]
MAHLTVLVLVRIPCGLAAGILDHLVTSSHCRTSVDVNVEGYPRVPLLCQQVGRLCRWLGDAGNEVEPSLNIHGDSLSVSMGGNVLLALQDHASYQEEQDTGLSQSSQLVRLCLAEMEGPSFKGSINEAFVWSDTVLSSVNGIEIMDDFFPNICGLNITAQVVLDGMVRALSETKTSTGGLPQWRLQKLSELEIKLFSHDDTYDGLIDMVIKRTQAAALPQPTMSPITKLTLMRGSIQPESLCRLDEMGIQYTLQ